MSNHTDTQTAAMAAADVTDDPIDIAMRTLRAAGIDFTIVSTMRRQAA